METRDDGHFIMSSPRSSISLLRSTLAKTMIRALREDTYLFVLLVCWEYREVIECNVHMER